MKIISAIILGLITVSCFLTPKATAIEDPLTLPNNKFGIHILEPSELERAAQLVNSSGGDWGYVTIPIQASDRDKDKWQAFMHSCEQYHLIPILRITTIPQGGTWQEGQNTDLVDFANFLSDLAWPTTNRYSIIFNEVNRSTEWGGVVDPAKYARILKNARTIFKERSADFFILPAGLDNALPSSATSMRAPDYLRAMMREDPAIWSYIDGWNSHSYPNPAFSAPPTQKGWTSITSYVTELKFIAIAVKPVFITETGWVNTKLGEAKRAEYLARALSIWAADPQVVAITPFLLSAGAGDFVPFSWLDQAGNPTPTYQTYQNYGKTAGRPTLIKTAQKTDFVAETTSNNTEDISLPLFKTSRALLKLENLFRSLLGLTTKSSLTVGNHHLIVEIASNPKQWEVGLSHHTALSPNAGMYFQFPHKHIPLFWMKAMTFPIDIIWIEDDVIVDFTLNAPVPTGSNLPTYSPRQPINRVLEINAGYVEKLGLKIGDTVQLINN